MTAITCDQTPTDIMVDYFYYREEQLVNVIQGQGQSQPGQRFFQTATGLAAQMNMGRHAGTWLIGTDVLGSVLGGSDGENAEEHCYAPYGGENFSDKKPVDNALSLGYTGAYRDPLTGLYPLGNGYRCYLPELMCFNKPDSLSPFGSGGINPRSYCENDPINHLDPSGHTKHPWMAGVGMVSGIIGLLSNAFAVLTGGLSLAVGIAAKTAIVCGAVSILSGLASVTVSNEDLSDALTYVSMGFGIASAIAGFGVPVRNLATRGTLCIQAEIEDEVSELTDVQMQDQLTRERAADLGIPLPAYQDAVLRSARVQPPNYEEALQHPTMQTEDHGARPSPNAPHVEIEGPSQNSPASYSTFAHPAHSESPSVLLEEFSGYPASPAGFSDRSLDVPPPPYTSHNDNNIPPALRPSSRGQSPSPATRAYPPALRVSRRRRNRSPQSLNSRNILDTRL